MRDNVKFILILVFFSLVIADRCHSYDPASSEPDVGLWLARSCVGEANFDSAESGECAALIHIYLKRTKPSGLSLYEVLRKYSGATKKRKNHPRKWLFHLDREGTRPLHWPKTKKKWETVRESWFDVLELCDSFLRGEIDDPLPDADHYGSDYDHWRAVESKWYELKTPFKNRFYSIDKPRGQWTNSRN